MNRRWLVTGASGQLGGHLLHAIFRQDPAARVVALAGSGAVVSCPAQVVRLDLEDEAALRDCVRKVRPTHILHVGAMTSVAQAYAEPQRAERVNTHATQVLVEAAADCAARFVFSSTDMVFDGTAAPYREADPPSPLSHYGRTKAAAERAVVAYANALVVRLPLMYGFACTDRPTTFAQQVAALRSGQPLQLFVDEFRTPVFLGDAARALIGLALSDKCGVIHVAGPQRLSRYELVERVAQLLSVRGARLVGVSRLTAQAPEPRPEDLSLNDELFRREFPQLAPGPIAAWMLEPFARADT